MTSQPDHSLADEPMADEPLPDDSRPAASVTPEPLPAEPLPPELQSADPLRPEALHEPVVIGRDTEFAETEFAETAENADSPALSVAPGRLAGQWHDIQAMFVDDPQGSVQRAAQVADAAVAALATSLRNHQAALGSEAASKAANDTEQLREALVEFRGFYERLTVLAEQLGTAWAHTSDVLGPGA